MLVTVSSVVYEFLFWAVGNVIEKGSVLPDPPTGQSDKSDQKVDNIVAVYNRLQQLNRFKASLMYFAENNEGSQIKKNKGKLSIS